MLQTQQNKQLGAKFTPEEVQQVRKAQAANWMILKGAQYIEEHGEFRGKPYVSRYILNIHKINNKYGIYKSQAIN